MCQPCPSPHHARSRATSRPTFLCQPASFVVLELVLVAGALHRGVAPGAGPSDLHGLVKELEAVGFVNGLLGRLGVLEDDESLAFGFQVRLGDDVDDVAILGEDNLQRGLERLGLDALLEVAHIDPVRGRAG